MFYGSVSGPQAVILMIAKLAATTAVYAWGGAGGIFSPTLFFGSSAGDSLDDYLAHEEIRRLGNELSP
jgi:H+/Cl- antiporter ClcA